ncbi:MAG: hypothetical protein IT434_03205 [Phycisphaerales bacterium]|jgi:hypothetical protein|nr:hypothetical protein [Phycisphaerales bacterium]
MTDASAPAANCIPPMRQVPGLIRGLTGLLCGLTLLSALAGAYWGLAGLWPRIAWPLVGFEIVTILACVFGLLVARGKFADGPGLTILCIAGLIMTGGVLAWLGANKVHAGLNLKPFMLARLGVAGTLYALAAISEVWYSRPAAVTLAKAIVYSLVFAAIAAAFAYFRNAPIMDKMEGWREGARLIGLGIAAILAVIGACGGVHLAVRAFAIAREPESAA